MTRAFKVSLRALTSLLADAKFEEMNEELRRLDGELKMLKRRSGPEAGEGGNGESLPADAVNGLYEELSLLRAELCSKAQFEEFKQSTTDKLKELHDLCEKNDRAAKKNYDFII